MRLTKLSTSLAIALAVVACKKKEDNTPAAKPADNPGAMTKTEPAKTEPAKTEAPKPMTGAELAEQYKKCNGLLNDGKLDDFGKTCVDASFVMHGPMGDMKGDDLQKHFADMKVAFPDMKHEPQLIAVSGRSIYAVALMTGTQSGVLKMPGMPDVPPTNKKIANFMFHKITLNDANKATEEWAFADMGTMMSQLGLSPKGAPAMRAAADMKPWDGAPITVVAADDAKEKANLEAANKVDAAFNAHKAADLVALLTDDVVETEYAAPKDHKGKKELEKGLKDFQAAFSDAKATMTNVAAGDYVFSIGNFEGTNDHDMAGEMKMKKTGKHVNVPMTEIMHFKDGKIDHVWRFFNGMDFAMQLGMMPPPGEAPKGDTKKGDEKKPADTKAPAKAPAKK